MAEENTVAMNSAGELLLAREKEIFEHIGRLDRRLDNWQEALPDLNQRMKKLEELLPQAVDEVKKQTAKLREIQQGVDNSLKISARIEVDAGKRLEKLEQTYMVDGVNIAQLTQHIQDAGVRLVELESFQLHHSEDHEGVAKSFQSVATQINLVNESIRDLIERISRLERVYNQLLEHTDKGMAAFTSRLSGLDASWKDLEEKVLPAIRVEMKNLANKAVVHDLGLEELRSMNAPPVKIEGEDIGLPSQDSIRCPTCKNGNPEMTFEISGYRVGAKGCALAGGEGGVVYFRGHRCSKFQER